MATHRWTDSVGHGLGNFTSEIQMVKAANPKDRSPVVFVDTPGFDDVQSDTDILSMVAEWQEKM